MLTVEELIAKLLLVKDKSKKVYYFDSEREDGDQLHAIDSVRETFFDIDDIAVIEFKD
jgi:hypothetical protein